MQAQLEALQTELEEYTGQNSQQVCVHAVLARTRSDLATRCTMFMAVQLEIQRKRETELTRLRKELETANAQAEAAEAALRKKNQGIIAEMQLEIENLQKVKSKYVFSPSLFLNVCGCGARSECSARVFRRTLSNAFELLAFRSQGREGQAGARYGAGQHGQPAGRGPQESRALPHVLQALFILWSSTVII